MTEKEKIAEAIRKLYSRGLITLSEGNVSVRKGNGFLITPGGLRKDRVEPSHIALVSLEGEIICGRPSSEYLLHLEIYRKRPDVNAVVHAHPPFVLSLASAEVPLKYPVLGEAVFLLGPVPIVDFSLPSSRELAEKAGEASLRHDALLLENHGAVTLAPNLDLALAMMETLERTAEVLWRGLLLGKVKLLDREQVKELLSLRQRYGLPPRDWSPEDFLWSL